MPAPFHLAIPVDNVAKARTFYRDTLALSEGRSSEEWVDFDFLATSWSFIISPKKKMARYTTTR